MTGGLGGSSPECLIDRRPPEPLGRLDSAPLEIDSLPGALFGALDTGNEGPAAAVVGPPEQVVDCDVGVKRWPLAGQGKQARQLRGERHPPGAT